MHPELDEKKLLGAAITWLYGPEGKGSMISLLDNYVDQNCRRLFIDIVRLNGEILKRDERPYGQKFSLKLGMDEAAAAWKKKEPTPERMLWNLVDELIELDVSLRNEKNPILKEEERGKLLETLRTFRELDSKAIYQRDHVKLYYDYAATLIQNATKMKLDIITQYFPMGIDMRAIESAQLGDQSENIAKINTYLRSYSQDDYLQLFQQRGYHQTLLSGMKALRDSEMGNLIDCIFSFIDPVTKSKSNHHALMELRTAMGEGKIGASLGEEKRAEILEHLKTLPDEIRDLKDVRTVGHVMMALQSILKALKSESEAMAEKSSHDTRPISLRGYRQSHLETKTSDIRIISTVILGSDSKSKDDKTDFKRAQLGWLETPTPAENPKVDPDGLRSGLTGSVKK